MKLKYKISEMTTPPPPYTVKILKKIWGQSSYIEILALSAYRRAPSRQRQPARCRKLTFFTMFRKISSKGCNSQVFHCCLFWDLVERMYSLHDIVCRSSPERSVARKIVQILSVLRTDFLVLQVISSWETKPTGNSCGNILGTRDRVPFASDWIIK